ncbi:MAG TPA: hypothetical protein EYP90_10735 [Chromatiaceae bacterium]|nr:hypothetical protein [Chromatiaceae bacterium]HIP70517.1 hypothetical protein [Anaerolineae bacterium]
MDKTISTMSPQEFETMVEQAIDRRMQVWLTQLFDALGGFKEEDNAPLQPDFTVALERSIEQARAGNVIDINDFRKSLANG